MRASTPGILVLEGADASGKTTLARYLVQKHGARYLHLGPHQDIWRWHLGAYLRAQRLAAQGHLVVVDRHWLTECIYGSVYRNGSAYPVAARCFDRLWLRSAAVYVLCVPSDPVKQAQAHYARDLTLKGNAYARDRARPVAQVIAYYNDLCRHNLAQPGDDYLAQWTRFGDWAKRADVRTYDWCRDGARLYQVVESLLGTLTVTRADQHPLGLDPVTPNFAGHRTQARWLLVGEAVSPGVTRHDVRFPFVDRCSHLSSATWLNRALHQLAAPETRLLWCNAVGPELAVMAQDERLHSLPAVALGKVAGKALQHLGWVDVREVAHPQWARRFNHNGDYAAQLKEVLV